jgi:hypothetical protein
MGGSPIQARYREDAYPISRFILDRARTLGLTRGDLAARLGYRNISKAHRALSSTLTTGTVPPHMAAHLAGALEADEPLMAAVMAATQRQQEDEARSRLLARETAYRTAFKPQLRIETARTVPQPIFVTALVGTARLRLVALPDEVWCASGDERDRLVKQAIQAHYRERRGSVPAFGAIIGYTLVSLPGYLVDFGFPYDPEGNPTGPMRPVERLGEATLGKKRGNTRLTGRLKNAPIKLVPINGDDGWTL